MGRARPGKLSHSGKRCQPTVDEVEQCLVDEALAKRLAKPILTWNFERFDVVLSDELTWVFDRVHLFADRAEIIDFKTEKAGEEAADRHCPQLQLPFRISQANRLGRVSD